MNKKLLRELKAATMAADEIITWAWAALAIEVHSYGWSSAEIEEFINDVQLIWSNKADDVLIYEATEFGVDVLDYTGYKENAHTRYGKRNQLSHRKAKWTVAALFGAVIEICRSKYKWSQTECDIVVHNSVVRWNDSAKHRTDLLGECEAKTGFDFRYQRQA